MKQNHGINIICALFTVAAVVDLISTLRLGELVQYLEANPLYRFAGLTGIMIVNLLLVAALIWCYYKAKSPTLRFSILSSMVTITIIRSFVVYANWQIGNNPPTIEVAQQVTQEAKNMVLWAVALKTLTPYIISMITFGLFTLDHEIHPKTKK